MMHTYRILLVYDIMRPGSVVFLMGGSMFIATYMIFVLFLQSRTTTTRRKQTDIKVYYSRFYCKIFLFCQRRYTVNIWSKQNDQYSCSLLMLFQCHKLVVITLRYIKAIILLVQRIWLGVLLFYNHADQINNNYFYKHQYWAQTVLCFVQKSIKKTSYIFSFINY